MRFFYTCFECLDDFFFFFVVCAPHSCSSSVIEHRLKYSGCLHTRCQVCFRIAMRYPRLHLPRSAGVSALACQTAALSSNCLYLLSQRHPELQRLSRSPAELVPPQFIARSLWDLPLPTHRSLHLSLCLLAPSALHKHDRQRQPYTNMTTNVSPTQT